MALTDRAAEAIGGPTGGSTWYDSGDSFTLQNHASVTATTTQNDLPAQTVTRRNMFILNGSLLVSNVDGPDSLNRIQTLYGFQITPSAALAAQSTLSLFLSVYRTVGTLGVLVASGTPITSITLAKGLTQALPSGSVLTLTNSAGNTQAVTLSAAAVLGATVIAINSVTPGNAYAVGNPVVWQVGNQGAFGWLAAGAGTPLMGKGQSVLAPPLTGNTSVVTAVPGGTAPAGVVGSGALLLQEADTLIFSIVTSSGTVVIPVSNVQPLMT